MAERHMSLKEIFHPNGGAIAEISTGALITTVGNILLEDSLTVGIALGLGGIAVMGHGLHRFDRPSRQSSDETSVSDDTPTPQ